MRTIKFRAKAKNSNYWLYGDLMHAKDGSVCIYDDYTVLLAEVDPTTVGQFTGAKDDCGQEIYEGDIIHYVWKGEDVRSVAEVAYCDKWAQFTVRDDETSYNQFFTIDAVSISILGNKYDNPELLKK